MLKLRACCAAGVVCLVLWPLCAAADMPHRKSIVKIRTTYDPHDYYRPWRMQGSRYATGSGFIVEGRRILTNAHLVHDWTYIIVRLAGRARQYEAEVEFVSHDLDLALLRVRKADEFFAGTEPVAFGGLPELGEEVTVYGFPSDGSRLAVTRGIVSRIERMRYFHSGANNLICQVDAPINPGSSGGAVFSRDRAIGVAFQNGGGENVSHIIPMPVVTHFLTDIRDGRLDGTPKFPLHVQYLRNDGLRAYLGMSPEQTGVRLSKLAPEIEAGGGLKLGDVLLAVDGYPLGNDGTIEFQEGQRISFFYLMERKQIGELLAFSLLRDGEPLKAVVKLDKPYDEFILVPGMRYERPPSYLIVGGLVFSPVSVNLLKTWGNDWYDDAPREYTEYLGEHKTPDREQVIALIDILDENINKGYAYGQVVEEVNGQRPKDIRAFARLIAENQKPYLVIGMAENYQIVLPTAQIAEKTAKVLRMYNVPADRSADLRPAAPGPGARRPERLEE